MAKQPDAVVATPLIGLAAGLRIHQAGSGTDRWPNRRFEC
jgi:hypothetical protein